MFAAAVVTHDTERTTILVDHHYRVDAIEFAGAAEILNRITGAIPAGGVPGRHDVRVHRPRPCDVSGASIHARRQALQFRAGVQACTFRLK
ncbi:MAG: hypothetical protein AMXMBFR57_27380 [Acidimicrobiia bacterium]